MKHTESKLMMIKNKKRFIITILLAIGLGVSWALLATFIFQSASAQQEITFPLKPTPAQHITWQVAQGLQPGDQYNYRICNSVDAVQIIHPKNCYTLEMTFVYKTQQAHHIIGNPIWIVDITFDGLQTIMFFDDITMQMHPTNNWDNSKAASVQNTILHLAQYGEQRLRVGAHWDDVDTYYYTVPLVISSMITTGGGDLPIANATLEYNAIKRSHTDITSNLAFPTYSIAYDPFSFHNPPEILYEYKLIEKVNYYDQYTKSDGDLN